MVNRLIAYLLLLALGSLLGSLSSVQEGLLAPWCELEAALSGVLMHAFGSGVERIGAELHDPETGQGILVLWACSGADATFILLAAILVYPASFRSRIKGILAGFIVVQGMNVLRIISLFYLNLSSREWFEFAHLYLWQGLLMVDLLVFMLLWLRWERVQGRTE